MTTLFDHDDIRPLLEASFLAHERGSLYYTYKGARQLLAWTDGQHLALSQAPLSLPEDALAVPKKHHAHAGALLEALRRVGAASHLQEIAFSEVDRPEVDRPGALADTSEEPYPSFPDFFVTPSSEMEHFVMSDDLRDALTGIYRLVERGHKEVILVTGPTGTGKTSLAEYFALKSRRPLYIVDCGAYSDALDFFGAKDLEVKQGHQTITWFEHDFVQAVETEQAVVVLDEANRLHPAHLNALFPLFDHRGRIHIPGMPRPVRVAEGVTFFLTMNVGAGYAGTYQTDAAFINRVTRHLETYYLDPDREGQLVQQRTGLRASLAEKLVELARRIREQAAGEDALLQKAVSTRDVLKTAEMMRCGLKLEKAVRVTFLNHFSAEGGAASERATVLQVVQSVES